MPSSPALSVLVVDGDQPCRAHLAHCLTHDDRVGQVWQAASGADALRFLEDSDVDAVFLDVAMPGLSGLDVAKVLGKFRRPPAVVFVTAHDEYAVWAFEINAVDFLLKPVSEPRVNEAVRRIVAGRAGGSAEDEDETIAVELAGVTRFVRRSEVRYVESQGDYARLHTADESHLVRIPMAVLEERWRAAGFLRIHRQCLVSVQHVAELRQDGGHCSVVVAGTDLTVSRRHMRELRDILVRRPQPLCRAELEDAIRASG